MRRTFSIYFMTALRSAKMEFAWEGATNPTLIEFLGLFGTVHAQGVAMDGAQRATLDLKQRVANFVLEKGKAIPQLKAFEKLIRDLPDDDYFLLLPSEPASTSERLGHEQFIAHLNDPVAPAQAGEYDPLFGSLLRYYDIRPLRTDRPTLIGNRRKDQRRCRFCGETAATGATFGSIAHAIPAALGNRYLKLADECEACNAYFGSEVEPHLIRMLDIQRVILGTQGRGSVEGRPKLAYPNGTIFHDGERMFITCASKAFNDVDGVVTVDLGPGPPIIPARCYRALVKILLSVIAEDQLPSLKDTIAWVRHGTLPRDGVARLPPVAIATVDLPSDPSAQISLYQRHVDDRTLPHVVGEFRLGPYLYAFIVPFSARDEGDLTKVFETAAFKDVFRHYEGVRGWRMQRFSSEIAVAAPSILRFIARDQS